MKILVYDCETTDLDADNGDLLAIGYKWLGNQRVYAPSVLDYGEECDHGKIHFDEEPLVRKAYEVLGAAEMQITFNGKNFDLGFLNTKFMKYHLPALPVTGHVDLYQVAKTKMRLRPKSLKNIARYLGLRNQKMDLPWSVWQAARKGDPSAIRLIRTRGRSDVLLTEELYLDHLRQYVTQHPRVNGWGPCRRCGEDALQRRGSAITIYRGQQYRFQCSNCGGWETRPQQ